MFPTVTSFILRDKIEKNARQKLYLLGLFNAFEAVEFPATFRDTWMYCALTNGRGEVQLTVRLTDAAELDATPVITTEVPVKFRGPLDAGSGAVLRGADLPQAGCLGVAVGDCRAEEFHELRVAVRKVSG